MRLEALKAQGQHQQQQQQARTATARLRPRGPASCCATLLFVRLLRCGSGCDSRLSRLKGSTSSSSSNRLAQPQLGCARAGPRAAARRCCLCGCCAGGADALALRTMGQQRQSETLACFWSPTSPRAVIARVSRLRKPCLFLVANKPSGRHSAREPVEDELWPLRALLTASASRCSS
jgi:hypothetical protein